MFIINMVATTLLLTAAAGSSQEVYLSENPQINIFKFSYYKYVNFATETVAYPLYSDAAFGNKTTVTIPKKGHLLSKMYLELTLPQLTPTDGTYLSWVDTIGYAIFKEPIELMIGGSVVDRLYPVCMDIQDELNTTTKRQGKDRMILKSDVYRNTLYNATQEVVLKIPLEFWFTKDYSLSLPVFCMPNQDIQINFTFSQFADLINFDGTIGTNQTYQILDSKILVEYIFLDDIILPTYTNNTLTYLIEQQTYNGKEPVNANVYMVNSKCHFDNSSKELLFACVSNDNLNANNYFNYSVQDMTSNNYYDSTVAPFISEIGLFLNGTQFYEDYLPEHVFREILPNNVHDVIPNKHLYIFPFCTKASSVTQPTGSINMSRFDSVVLSLRMRPNNPSCMLYVFSISYNIVTIQNGILSFAFNNS